MLPAMRVGIGAKSANKNLIMVINSCTLQRDLFEQIKVFVFCFGFLFIREQLNYS